MIRTQIQLTEEQAEQLKKIAAIKHVSMAKLIRQAVSSFIKSTSVVSDEEKRQRAAAVAGRFKSGVSDLSKAHDKYLNEAYK